MNGNKIMQLTFLNMTKFPILIVYDLLAFRYKTVYMTFNFNHISKMHRKTSPSCNYGCLLDETKKPEK